MEYRIELMEENGIIILSRIWRDSKVGTELDFHATDLNAIPGAFSLSLSLP